VVLRVQGGVDVLVSTCLAGAQGCHLNGQASLDGLLEVGDVRLDLAGRRLARGREVAERVEGVEPGAALAGLHGPALHVRPRRTRGREGERDGQAEESEPSGHSAWDTTPIPGRSTRRPGNLLTLIGGGFTV
jgi:hypothetical protein